MEQGKLYLVATPIGNLNDMTFRAVETLKEVDEIAAEDTRQTLKLLNHFGINKPMFSYHRHNEDIKVDQIIEKIKSGKNIAIVTDAGTPGISDPGEVAVQKAIEENIEIVPIPGACAMINALIVSGIDTKEFAFYGFLPTNNKLRKIKLEEILNEKKTSIIYEAPHRLIDTLKDFEKLFESRPYKEFEKDEETKGFEETEVIKESEEFEKKGKFGKIEKFEKVKEAEKNERREIAIAHELTKIHESVYRGTATELIEKIGTPKGEYVIVIEGNSQESENKLNEMTLEEHYKFYEQQGLEKKEIIKKIAKDMGVSKNEIYQKFI